VGKHRSVDPGRRARRQQADGCRAQGRRPDADSQYGLPVARPTEEPAAAWRDKQLFLPHAPAHGRGLPLCAIVHAAEIQDRNGGVLLMSARFAPLSVSAQALGQPRLPGAQFQTGTKARLPKNQTPDRQAPRRRQVRGAAQTADHRTSRRMAQPPAPPRQGPGMPEPQRAGISARGNSPDHGQKGPSENHVILGWTPREVGARPAHSRRLSGLTGRTRTD
jgi:hypothetical protein